MPKKINKYSNIYIKDIYISKHIYKTIYKWSNIYIKDIYIGNMHTKKTYT